MFAKSSIGLRKSFLVLVTLAAVTALGFVAAAKLKNGPRNDGVAGYKSSEMVVAPDKPTTRVPSHILTLRSNGFEPGEVTWPKGQFFLMIDNRSPITDITLRLDMKTGGHLKEVSLNMKKKRSLGVFDPPPGDYVLTEINHPEWVCQITISPH